MEVLSTDARLFRLITMELEYTDVVVDYRSEVVSPGHRCGQQTIHRSNRGSIPRSPTFLVGRILDYAWTAQGPLTTVTSLLCGWEARKGVHHPPTEAEEHNTRQPVGSLI